MPSTLSILKQHGRTAQRIGMAVSDPQKIVRIPRPRACRAAQAILAAGRGGEKGGVIASVLMARRSVVRPPGTKRLAVVPGWFLEADRL